MTMKKALAVPALAAVLALACAAVVRVDTSTLYAAETEDAAIEVPAASLIAVHEAAGMDISAIDEASYANCTTCHDWESTVASTEDMWAGLGQITDANPHAAHATNAFACSDCHTMQTAQVNVCNQCHIFETPEGWVEMDKTKTNYGITATEPMF